MKKCAWHGFINGRILIKIPSRYFLFNRIGFLLGSYVLNVWFLCVTRMFSGLCQWSSHIQRCMLLGFWKFCLHHFYGLAGVGLQMYTGIPFYISQHPMWHSFVFSANQISDHLGGGGYDSSVGDKCFASFLDRELEGRIINFVFFLLMAFNVLYACFLALWMKWKWWGVVKKSKFSVYISSSSRCFELRVLR